MRVFYVRTVPATPAIKYVGYEKQESLKVGVKVDCRISKE